MERSRSTDARSITTTLKDVVATSSTTPAWGPAGVVEDVADGHLVQQLAQSVHRRALHHHDLEGCRCDVIVHAPILVREVSGARPGVLPGGDVGSKKLWWRPLQ